MDNVKAKDTLRHKCVNMFNRFEIKLHQPYSIHHKNGCLRTVTFFCFSSTNKPV